MDLKDQIKIIGERVAKLKEQTTTEEATKLHLSCHLFRHRDMMCSIR